MSTKEIKEAYQQLLIHGNPNYAHECIYPNNLSLEPITGSKDCPSEYEEFWTPLHLKCCRRKDSKDDEKLQNIVHVEKHTRKRKIKEEEEKNVDRRHRIELPLQPPLKMFQTNIIEGPMSAKLYAGLNRLILLFFDEHSAIRQDNCHNYIKDYPAITVDKWIDETILNNPSVLFDIFLESYQFETNDEIKDENLLESRLGYLNRTRVRFNSCLNPSLRLKCPYSNARFHNTDFRSLDMDFTSILYAILSILTQMKYDSVIDQHHLNHLNKLIILWIKYIGERLKLNFDGEEDMNIPVVANFLQEILEINKEKIKKQWRSVDTEYPKIKEIVDYSLPQLFDPLLFNNLAKLIVQWPRIMDKIRNNPEKYHEIISNIDLLILQYEAIYRNIMDEYLLARLFRTWKNPEHGRQSGIPVHLAIIYVGGNHANTYDQIFRSLGMRVIGEDVTGHQADHVDRWVGVLKREFRSKCLNVADIFPSQLVTFVPRPRTSI